MWRALAEEINDAAESYRLAVSGGVDSMFLLDFFARRCRRPIEVRFFDHGLRSESVVEGRMVERVAATYDLPFVRGRGDAEAMRSARSLEAEARDQRWAFLEEDIPPGEVVATGHHADDQVETVVMRLMRGVPEGALRMRRLEGTRYKPLLSVPKATIVEQCRSRGIGWMDDPSNLSLDHERNWVRHEVIPMMMTRRNVMKTIGLQPIDDILETPEPSRSPRP